MEKDIFEQDFVDYLETIKSENSKNSIKTTIKRLVNYLINNEINDIKDVKDVDIDIFLKRELTGKSETTISNELSRIKKIFKYYNNEEAVKHLNLKYFKKISETRENKYLTPNEVHELIKSLLNYQDKALVLMCYIGLYDDEFNTIRHLKINQLKNKRIILEDGREIKLNNYSNRIIENAIKEDEMEKYVFQENRYSKPYKLNTDTPYIFKSKLRKGGTVESLPAITMKKKFDLFGKFSGIDRLSPVMIKNSRILYDLVKLEYEENLGLDINQMELKNYCQENNMKCQIEKMNIAKKDIKLKIISEIVSGKTHFIEEE